jgi:NitT/TauT family transport system substrate-binding protein
MSAISTILQVTPRKWRKENPMRPVTLKRFAWLLVCLFTIATGLASPSLAQTKLTPVRLRLDWTWQAPQAIFTIAYERGYYRDEGLDVSIDRGYGGLDNASALASGNYEFLFGDMGNVILFNAQSPDRKLLSVFTIYDAYLGAVITRAGNGIAKPKDLEGKTIGAPLTTGGRTMFPAFAKANDIDESKVNWDTISIDLQDQQFARGQFDAVASFTTTSLLNLKQLGVSRDKLTIFNFADYGVDLYGSGVVTRADYVRQNPEIVRKFVRATMRGIAAMLANKSEAIDTLKKRDPLLDPGIELDRLNLMIEMTLKRPNVETNGVGSVDPARVQSNIDTITKVFKVSPAPQTSEIYTTDFLPPKDERMLKF